MRIIAALLMGVWCFSTGFAQTNASAGTRWYVQAGKRATADGRSWQSAFASLQEALTAARSGDEIWVAQGTYHPDAGDPDKSFVLKEKVALYGGFQGDETARESRDFKKHASILSGDIGNGDRTKNTRTIVMGADGAVLDGFTIADAYGVDKPRMHLVAADILKGDMVVGGGMRNFMTAPTVRNCVFKNNRSPKGGAVYNVHKDDAAQAVFINVDFLDNTAGQRGGAVSNDLGAMPVFINCRFERNVCDDKGGALYNDFAASPVLVNCLFKDNRAGTAGGVGNDGGSSPLIVASTIEGNTATSGLGAGLYQGTGASNDPILIGSAVDDIYNWHEDFVGELNSSVPPGQTVGLAAFVEITNLKGEVTAEDLKAAPTGKAGYRAQTDGEALLENPLVAKLYALHLQNKGKIAYQNAYERPAVTAPAAQGPVVYAAADSAAKHPDGASWATAFADVQTAIESASQAKAAVWVKAGTYRPAVRDKSRIAAFILYDDVRVYGGFAGKETKLDERPDGGAPTILSAKAADGGVYAHVIYGANAAALDGLTLREGRAKGFLYDGKGGGLLAYHAGKVFWPHDPAIGFTMTVSHCRFEENKAQEGGAIYAFGKAVLNVSDTVFESNQAVYGGAVVMREGGTFAYADSVFNGNAVAKDGGAVYADYGAHATFSRTQFLENRAAENGGAVYEISRASQLEGTQVSLEKCSFLGNRALAGASIYVLDACTLSLKDTEYPDGSVRQP